MTDDLDQLRYRQAFSPREVADLTGFHVNTIRRHIRDGKLKAMQVGSKGDYRVSRPALNEWWESNGGGPLFAPDTVEADEGAA